MPLYVPSETLPIYPTYSTVLKDGVKYKAYFETDWHQVMTEDGVPLCELLKSMPAFSANNFYKYCGIFKSTPEESAIDQMYAITTQQIGDVYLIETDILTDTGYVCEAYVWLGNSVGWVYCGTTNRRASLNKDLPEVISLFPNDLGEPNQILVIGEDGKSITWGDPPSVSIDVDIDAIAKEVADKALDIKADKLVIFNDTLVTSRWVYNKNYPCFEYLYTNDNLVKNCYFEIAPVVDTANEVKIVTDAKISSIYRIKLGEDHAPYAVLRAKHVPAADIKICVKSFGTYDEK